MSDTFTCAKCGGTFAKAWSDEAMLAEAEREYPWLKAKDRSVICGDCYRAFKKWEAANTLLDELSKP